MQKCVALALVAVTSASVSDPAVAAAPIKVSCVGDSITAEGGNMTYSLQLQRLLAM